MIITYPENNTSLELISLGRNGAVYTKGLIIKDYSNCVSLQPVTSKGYRGRCRIELPDDSSTLLAIANQFTQIANQRSQEQQTPTSSGTPN